MRRFSSAVAFGLLAVAASTAGCGKSFVEAPPVRWHTDVDSAGVSATAQNKPLVVFFGADWDVAAKELEQLTFTDPDVRALLGRHFVSVKVDTTDVDDPETHKLGERFKVLGDPTVIILGPDGSSELARFHSYIPAPVLARALRAALRAPAATGHGH